MPHNRINLTRISRVRFWAKMVARAGYANRSLFQPIIVNSQVIFLLQTSRCYLNFFFDVRTFTIYIDFPIGINYLSKRFRNITINQKGQK